MGIWQSIEEIVNVGEKKFNYEAEKEKLTKYLKEKESSFRNITWNETINNYSNTIQKTKEILEILKKEEYFIDLIEEINDSEEELDKYLIKALNPEYQIAIVGAIKAGKSTLINALIDCNLASVDVTPETAVLTKFKYSNTKNYLKISFYNEEEWNQIWNSAIENRAEVFLKEYQNLNAEEIKNEYIGKKIKYSEFESIEELKSEIIKSTSSKSKEHYFVKELEIGLTNLNIPHQVCIVDTPGLNDVVEYRSNITKKYIENANAVMVCVNAKTLRNEEMVTITKVFDKAQYKRDKVLVLGTQIDTMNSIEDWEKQRKEWIKYLESSAYYGSLEKASQNLIGISAEAYNISKTKFELNDIARLKIVSEKEFDEIGEFYYKNNKIFSNEISDRIVDKMVEFSGIKNLEKIIKENFIKEYRTSLLKDFEEDYKILNRQIMDFANRHKKLIEQNIENSKKSKEELEKCVIEGKENLLRMKKRMAELDENVNDVKESFNNEFEELKEGFEELKTEIRKIRID